MNLRMTPAFVFILCFSLARPLHAAKYKIHWLIGHPTVDYFEEAAASFKDTVERKSHGEISVEIVTAKSQWENSGETAPSAEIAAKVASGEAEMGHSFTDVMGGLDHRLWAFDVPFLFRDYQHQEQVFEGPLGTELLDGLRDHHLVGLTFTYSGGANIISGLSQAIKEPGDMKGLRVAVFGSEVDKAWLTSLGAVPVPIGHQEDSILGLAQRNAIDAAVLTWRRHSRLVDVRKKYRYGSLEGATYLVSVTYMNDKFFDGLPRAYRTLISEAAREAGRIERSKTIELNAFCKRRMLSKGLQVVELSEGNKRGFLDALRPVFEGSLEPLVGKALIDRIRRTGAEERLASARP